MVTIKVWRDAATEGYCSFVAAPGSEPRFVAASGLNVWGVAVTDQLERIEALGDDVIYEWLGTLDNPTESDVMTARVVKSKMDRREERAA